ncbi:11211_t:CDS:2 [Cetraspora pellucida]|uniref:11211_t:CDS:1 n=1 Tax=Cetraspora pellucida TaxID=1433469 RepID=A0ACA9MNC2_9GLOM|nr:11211_t:CDS:2 [Cetraspora pellucida]
MCHLRKRLGRGGSETVYLAKSNSLGYAAIKEVESETDEKAQKLFINEQKQLSRSNHKRIIKFYGISFDKKEKTHYLVMEYADNAEGISYLHDIDITHHDLHTVNILIHKREVKISDFGFSKNLNTAAVTDSKLYELIPFVDPCKLNDLNSFSNQGYDASFPLKIIQGLRENPIPGTPVQYIDLYSKCWNYEPNKCPSMLEIVQQLNFLELDPKYDNSN